MATIERQDPVQLSQSWGASFSDYKVRGEQVDFQDLMVAIAQNRAVTVEGEVAPLSTRIKNRNKYLEDLGQALSEATNKQASFASDDKGDKVMSGWFSAAATATMRKAGCGGKPAGHDLVALVVGRETGLLVGCLGERLAEILQIPVAVLDTR